MEIIKKYVRGLLGTSHILDMRSKMKKITEMRIDDYIKRNLYGDPKYADPKRLNKYEYQCFSQNGEDGIIDEIFKRVGVTDRFFVEFGVENGLEDNSASLLVKGWKGLWIEGDPRYVKKIKEFYKSMIENNKLLVKQAFITAENIESLLKAANVPEDLDLLSIDIDGNDYWVWKSISGYRPRVVIVEYNSFWRPNVKWVMKYNPEHIWNGSCYYGASLRSLELLGKEKGYRLVGCDFKGVNAFFVREDLVKNNFCEPFTAENHYEPPRYFLTRGVGHGNFFGEFESI